MRTAVMAVSDISRIDFKGPRKLQAGQGDVGKVRESRTKWSTESVKLIIGKSTLCSPSWLYASLPQISGTFSGQ